MRLKDIKEIKYKYQNGSKRNQNGYKQSIRTSTSTGDSVKMTFIETAFCMYDMNFLA